MRPFLVGALLSGALTFGVMTLMNNNAVPAQNSGSQISNSPNAMIVNFPEGTLSEETKKLVNDEIAKRVSDRNAYAKQTLNFFEPVRNDPNARISLGEGEAKADISSAVVKALPQKYVAKKNNRFEDLSGVTVVLRAVDLDSKKTGWAGSIEGVTERVKVELDPTIDPVEIYGKTKIIADVTLERDFKQQANQMVPKRIIIRSIL